MCSMSSRTAIPSRIARWSRLSRDAAACASNLSLDDGAVTRGCQDGRLVHSEGGDLRDDVLSLRLASQEIMVALFLDVLDKVEDHREGDAH